MLMKSSKSPSGRETLNTVPAFYNPIASPFSAESSTRLAVGFWGSVQKPAHVPFQSRALLARSDEHRSPRLLAEARSPFVARVVCADVSLDGRLLMAGDQSGAVLAFRVPANDLGVSTSADEGGRPQALSWGRGQGSGFRTGSRVSAGVGLES